jgi:genome maintenance exonuclease 1
MQADIDRIGKVFAIEVPLWSNTVGLAGRTDCIGEFDGVPSVIDFKSSNYPKSEDSIQDYFMQATAYSLMWQDRTGHRLRNIAILIGVEDGGCQVFTADPMEYVEQLVETIRQYREELNMESGGHLDRLYQTPYGIRKKVKWQECPLGTPRG